MRSICALVTTVFVINVSGQTASDHYKRALKLKHNDYQQALTEANKALTLALEKRDSPFHYYGLRAEILVNLGRYKEAAEDYLCKAGKKVQAAKYEARLAEYQILEKCR